MNSDNQQSPEGQADTAQDGGDIPTGFKPADLGDYVRREEMIPMRDDVKLHTVILIPKGVNNAPMMLERTPYSASGLSQRTSGPQAVMQMYAFHGDLISAGYILVLQDVRGKFKSEGKYIMNLPLRGPQNDGDVDHATDAWDTIDWLVMNVPESNGRVGTIGISYDGFTALMSLVDPHPALAASVPINSMVDNWIGDDWYHNGAFRQSMSAQYIYTQTGSKNSELRCPAPHYDDYRLWLEAGSADEGGKLLGLDKLPFWKRLQEHQDYDEFWRGQAVDRILQSRPLTIPTLHVHSQWDAEDIYGPMAVHAALENNKDNRENNYLVIGPWSHPGVGFDDGYQLGQLRFGSDTASWFRQKVMLPFLDACLKEGGNRPDIAQVTAFESGANRWHSLDRWPLAGGASDTAMTPLYLAANGALEFDKPTSTSEEQFDEYISDPAKPVTYQQRPIRPKGTADSTWDGWLVDDQRFASARPDVLTYCSPPLTDVVRLAGQPVARLFASTTGTDADWIVKLIDVYPDQVAENHKLGGYELPVSMDILRGRYRDDPTNPTAIPPGSVVNYTLALPHVCHAFMPGHRIMVQIQSSWFPLYDRNPQSFVENIFCAKPEDFVKAAHRIYRGDKSASLLELPIIP